MPPMPEGQGIKEKWNWANALIGLVLLLLFGSMVLIVWESQKSEEVEEGEAYPFLMNCGVLDHYNQTISEIEIKSHNPIETIELGYKYNATFRIVCYQQMKTTLGNLKEGG